MLHLLCLLVLACQTVAAGESEPEPEREPARLKVSGYGLLGNLRLKRMLNILHEDKEPPRYYAATFIEDAALLLVSRLRDDGYLQPVITADLTLEDGSQVSYVWDESVEEPLPRPLLAQRAHFRIKEGVLFHFDALEFTGLESISEKQARGYFIETGGLLSLKRNRIYAPDRLDRGLRSLLDELQRMGFQNAEVTVSRSEHDDRTGAVDVRIRVRQGPKFIVRSVDHEALVGDAPEPVDIRTTRPLEPYSKLWEQDFAQSLRTNYYHLGYPDTAVQLQTIGREPETNVVWVDLRARVRTGPRIRVGDVGFVGHEHTKEAVLERRAPFKEGGWLDRLKAERGRYRLSRLGIFDSVRLQYDDAGTNTRNIIYELDEGKRIDVSLLFGYGSYELLRGGVQVDQYNVWGRAHHQRLKLVQSVKASSGDYTYTMPEFFGENVDVFFNASGLRREEISFTRLEYGGGGGVRKFFRNVDTDVSLRYNYQVLEASDVSADLDTEGVRNSRAAALILDVNHDRRDNPLYPERGYKAFSNIEVASDYLGGNVNYQRLDLSGSYHLRLGGSRWMHLGLSHGLIATIGSTSEDLPFNRRFFPGGENSIRGYKQGEAAPRNEEGKIVGAESYLLGNLEFEQGITPRWSLVAFFDAVGFAREFADYPANEALYSAGGGLRWKTFIGPIRLEYGHNLNPRSRDPSGTLHFSLGFPF